MPRNGQSAAPSVTTRVNTGTDTAPKRQRIHQGVQRVIRGEPPGLWQCGRVLVDITGKAGCVRKTGAHGGQVAGARLQSVLAGTLQGSVECFLLA